MPFPAPTETFPIFLQGPSLTAQEELTIHSALRKLIYTLFSLPTGDSWMTGIISSPHGLLKAYLIAQHIVGLQ